VASRKAIKQRINNVSTTKQIMKAMDTVSAARLQKARRTLTAARPFFEGTKEVIDLIKSSAAAQENIYVTGRKIKSSAYLIITGDRGFCGSYNTNVVEAALAHMEAGGKNEKIFVIGSKGYDYLKRRKKNIVEKITYATEAQMGSAANRLAHKFKDLYLRGEVDEVYVAFTYFASTLSYVPKVLRLLPLVKEEEIGPDFRLNYGIKFEPEVDLFLEQVVPLYLHAYLYGVLAESTACEHASRMINTDAASKNASELIEELNRLYHRRRQAEITQELSEIVGGANMLGKGAPGKGGKLG